MKKILKPMVLSLCAIFAVVIQLNAQWVFSGANIYNSTPGSGNTLNTTGNVGIGISAGLLQRLHVNGGLYLAGVIQKGGTTSVGTTDLGLYSLTNTYMRFVTNNNRILFFTDPGSNGSGQNVRLSIRENGYVGIGIENPAEKLHVDDGNIFVNGVNNFANTDDVASLTLGDANHFIRAKRGKGVSINTYTWASGQPEAKGIFLQEGTGNVGIGTDLAQNNYIFQNTTFPDHFKLAVNGPMRAKELVVQTGWSDFVFDKGYKLKSIEEIEEYIKVNGHLPEIPTAKEIEANGGNVGELLKLQMQKIEELTLYIIELNKKIEALKSK